jgi:hypothetical protein
MMAESNQITLKPVVQTADPQRVLPEGSSGNPPCLHPVSLP